jgi:endonuclease I
MFRRVLTYLLLLIASGLSAQPQGYYTESTLNGTNTSALRSAMEVIISNGHNVPDYADIWNAFSTTDTYPSSNTIWDMYSACQYTWPSGQCGNYTAECDCYNREHCIPQSWFGSALPMFSDLFHIYPSDGNVNNMKSNYPPGIVGTVTYVSGNGLKVGLSALPGYSGSVFEPPDVYKGDFARTFFYMATRYASVCQSWSSFAPDIFGGTNGLTPYATDLLLDWSRSDNVSQKETDRNNAVYAIQNNRNPFIDFPGLEEYIWGNKTTEQFSVYGSNPNTEAHKTLVTGTTVNFGKVSTSLALPVYVKADNLSGNLSVSVSGAAFSVSHTQISKAEAETGFDLEVVFAPLSAGTYSGTLTILGGGLQPPYELNLSGTK